MQEKLIQILMFMISLFHKRSNVLIVEKVIKFL